MSELEGKSVKCVIGLMSGTSMDGIDAAMIHTDGETIERLGPSMTIPYEAETRELIKAAVNDAASAGSPDKMTEAIRMAEAEITDLHIDAVAELMSVNSLAADNVDLIGFHGQTLAHRPDLGWSWQIGNGGRLAGRTGIPVVNDFRSNDMKSGGEGAPLVPLYQSALLRRDRKHEVIAILNIGGVANVTWVSFRDPDNPRIVAFDTGPGNALIDDWVEIHTGKPCDTDGHHAARGSVHQEILIGLMATPYFDEKPPKTLDRDDFNTQGARGLSLQDGAATLTEFMVESVVASQEHFPEPPEAWYVAGGGRHNKTLMRRLRRRFPVIIDPVEVLGWRGDALEAEAFAYLAARSVRGLPISLPSTTGVQEPTTGGNLHMPKGRRL